MNRYLAVGVGMLLVGVVLFGGGIYFTLQQEAELSGLQRTNGTVLSATVESAGEGFVPNVTYRYRVGEQNYTGSNVWPADQRQSGSREYASEVVGRYSEGQRVTVYYEDPADPSLRAPRSPTPIFAVGVGFVIIAFGFVFTAAGRQRGTDPTETDEVTLPGTRPEPSEGDSTDDPEDEPAGPETEGEGPAESVEGDAQGSE